MKYIHHAPGIVSFAHIFEPEWNDTYILLDEIIHKSIRPDMSMYISNESSRIKYPQKYQNFRNSNISRKAQDLLNTLDSVLIEAVIQYCRLFVSASWDVAWKTPSVLIEYVDGQFLGAHTDNTITTNKENEEIINQYAAHNTLTATIILNDDYDGGELFFPNWNLTIKPNRGTAIVYPSSYIGFHEVKEVKKNRRLAYISWFGHGNNGTENFREYTDMRKDMKIIRQQFAQNELVCTGRKF